MGSTGSIGRNALKVIAAWPDKFRVHALAGGKNLKLLAQQATTFQPPHLAVQTDPSGETDPIDTLRCLLPAGYNPNIFKGSQAFSTIAMLDEVDIVVSAQVGAAGLRTTIAAALAGKTICLANKESMVVAGPMLRHICEQTGAIILPVDSEHYALFQCLHGQPPDSVKRLILTASGGPFLGKGRTFLTHVRPQHALRHPTWAMGAKISVDSASLMNKGLEIIEACYLYNLPHDKVDVLVHPQSIVHSLVEFNDGSMLAQLAEPDMCLPIAACLAWPEKLDAQGTSIKRLDLTLASTLHFELPDTKVFPCLNLARQALEEGLCIQLNAANEIAVDRFLNRHLNFVSIPSIIKDIFDEARQQDSALPTDWAKMSVTAARAAARNATDSPSAAKLTTGASHAPSYEGGYQDSLSTYSRAKLFTLVENELRAIETLDRQTRERAADWKEPPINSPV